MSVQRRQSPAAEKFRPGFVISILVLFAVIYVIGISIPAAPTNPRAAEVRLAARHVLQVVHSYRGQHAGRAPLDTPELLTQLGEAELPVDPWGRPLTYHHSGAKHESTYMLSLGADGNQGGSGEDQDVVIVVGDAEPGQ